VDPLAGGPSTFKPPGCHLACLSYFIEGDFLCRGADFARNVLVHYINVTYGKSLSVFAAGNGKL